MTARARLVAIGTSAGGPAAVAEILSALPADFGAAIVVVQHMDAEFAPGLAVWLAEHSTLPLRLAREGDSPRAGEVLVIAGPDHMVLGRAGALHRTVHPRQSPYRPSIDVFFESVARNGALRAVGVLLTGMGRDGARGLKAMRHSGAFTIAQDSASSAVYGMPKAAVALDAACEVVPLRDIARTLVQITARGARAVRSNHE